MRRPCAICAHRTQRGADRAGREPTSRSRDSSTTAELARGRVHRLLHSILPQSSPRLPDRSVRRIGWRCRRPDVRLRPHCLRCSSRTRKVGTRPQAAPTATRRTTANAVRHGSVVIAAITSCTNTSNPYVMIAAGLLAKKAVERGLKRPAWVKTSLAPGSKVVTEYLTPPGLLPYLEQLASTWSATAAPPVSATPGRCRRRSRDAINDRRTWSWPACFRGTATSKAASTLRFAPTT